MKAMPAAEPHDAWDAFLRKPGEETFRPLYESTKRLVWTLCLRLLRDEADAAEAFQSTYCRLLELARGGGAAPWNDLAAGVSRLAIREADSLRKRRSRRRARETSLESVEPMKAAGRTPDGALERREVRQRVEAIVDDLPETQRLPLELHFFHGLSQREVAQALEQPLSTVADRIQRGLERLEPSFRRAGLKEAAATLGTLALSAALLEPRLSAAAVYGQAQAALAAGAATGSLITTTSILGGLTAMKLKAATLAAILVALLAGAITILGPRLRQPDAGDAARAVATPAAAPAVLGRESRAAAPPAPSPAPAVQSVAVQVLWEASAAPAAGARVSLSGTAGEPPAAAIVELEADADGKAMLAAPASWKAARLTARHELGGVTEQDVVLPVDGVLAIRIEEDAVTGTVADTATGASLGAAVVRCGEREAVADAAGVFALRGLGAGEHELTATADGHADQAALVRRERPGTTLQSFRLDPAASLTVLVVDAGGAPLGGARVTPSHLGSDAIFHGDKTRTADGRGRVRFEKVSKLRPPTFQAEAVGYATAYAKPVMDLARDESEHRVVMGRKQASRRSIIGRVADAAGHGIPDAVVEWKDGEGTQYGDGAEYGKIRALTDDGGRYRLDFDDDYDSCYLGVAARGWAPMVAARVRPGTPERPLELSFTLEPAHWLRGRVVDEGAKPLAGVTLHAMPSEGMLHEDVAFPAVLRQAVTDAEGRFELSDLAGPTVGIRLQRARGDDRPTLETETAVDRELDLVFPGYGIVQGRIVDAGTDEPVASFNIKLRGNGVRSELWHLGQTFTSPEGRFVMDQLHRNGKWTLIVEAEGYMSGQLEDAEAESAAQAKEHLIRLERGRAVTGVVADATTGLAIEGAQVACTTRKDAADFLQVDWSAFTGLTDFRFTITGKDGTFRLQESQPLTILVRAAGLVQLLVTPEARSQHRLPDGSLRLSLERGERVRGTVYFDGRPAPDVRIMAYRVEQGAPDEESPIAWNSRGRTGADGKFAWDDLAAGEHLLVIDRKVGEPRPETQTQLVRRFRVTPGEETVLEIGKEDAEITLRGTILGLETHETMWARLVLVPVDAAGQETGGDEHIARTYREWSWQWTCKGMARGRYEPRLTFYRQETPVRLPPIEVTESGGVELIVPAQRQ